MKPFHAFRQAFGAPRPGTGQPPDALGLAAAPGLADFVADVGGGIFRHGLLSVCSTREGDGSLAGWRHGLPAEARLFATGAFGTLFASGGGSVWVIDPHNGQIVESDIPLGEFFDVLAEPGPREDILRASLFDTWHELNDAELGTQVLCPTPAPALGGNWSLASLHAMSLPVFLSFTAQLFGGTPDTQVEIRRL